MMHKLLKIGPPPSRGSAAFPTGPSTAIAASPARAATAIHAAASRKNHGRLRRFSTRLQIDNLSANRRFGFFHDPLRRDAEVFVAGLPRGAGAEARHADKTAAATDPP